MSQSPKASFLNGFLRLCGKLAPLQRWHLAELAPTRKLAPMLVLKNCPLAIISTAYLRSA
jgi:hypothetical protein